MRMWWNKKQETDEGDYYYADPAKERYYQTVALFEDLDEEGLNTLIKGMRLAWEGYQKIMSVQGVSEKEAIDDGADEFLGEEDDYVESK